MENLENTSQDKVKALQKISSENLSTEAFLEFYFIDTINLWRNKLGELAKDFELSRLERRILVYIGRYPGIRQADLAFVMDVEPQSLTRSLENMENKKWLDKHDDCNDKRAKSLQLTFLGEKKLGDALLVSEQIRPKVLKDVSEQEKTILAKVLKTIRKNLEGII
ncbi:MarR family winged helix-turn-helix transcriptional regulator [Fluviispira multicolorata]|uniref:MarR family transcriptional regulator n=1 Tax=Fluviispira multicolorata TaxID=2654512 RepID=A0A833JH62_9BACT|nr:MarR family transcriptional regulator [Fluviispira multicolorata]KAB8033212.1 MarR family transcriptional regulator [Fluviispira multicolorata]